MVRASNAERHLVIVTRGPCSEGDTYTYDANVANRDGGGGHERRNGCNGRVSREATGALHSTKKLPFSRPHCESETSSLEGQAREASQTVEAHLDQPPRCVGGHDVQAGSSLAEQVPAGDDANRLPQAFLGHFAHAADLRGGGMQRRAQSQVVGVLLLA